MTDPRTQPGTTAAIDYGPAPNDCYITPLSFAIVWALLTFVLPPLISGVVS